MAFTSDQPVDGRDQRNGLPIYIEFPVWVVIINQISIEQLLATTRAKHYALPDITLIFEQVHDTWFCNLRQLVNKLICVKLFLPEKLYNPVKQPLEHGLIPDYSIMVPYPPCQHTY